MLFSTLLHCRSGGHVHFTLADLFVSDPDTALPSLMFVLASAPAFGFIENRRPLTGSEKERAGIPVTAFPYADLRDQGSSGHEFSSGALY